MSLADTIKNDYLAFDDIATESITINSVDGSTTTGVKAQRKGLTIEQAAQVGSIGLSVDSIIFNLFTATMGGAVVKQGDTITDENNKTFSIDRVENLTLGTRFRCTCSPHRI